MLDIHVRIDGDKAVIGNLTRIAGSLPRAVSRGLERAAQGVHRQAHEFLSGAGGTGEKVRTNYTGITKKSGEAVQFRSYAGAGGYPVPVRTGFLRQALDWLKPGETKSSPSSQKGHTVTFSAGPHEVIVYDPALYANAIHEGRGSSAKFGARRFLTDALEAFNQGDKIASIMNEEIGKEIPK